MQGWQIVRALDEIINIILRTLRGQRPPHADAYWTHGGWKAWTTDPQKNEELVRLYDKLTFEKFSFRSRWLQDPELAGQAIDPQNSLPDQIRSGWSIEGPEHDRGD
jgi:hypothetical protein